MSAAFCPQFCNLKCRCMTKNVFTETPFDQLPVLKVDDVTLCQSDAIEFYLAKQFGETFINIFCAVCNQFM